MTKSSPNLDKSKPEKNAKPNYFLWIWALLIISSVILSPRLGDSGLFNFIRIDDLLLPITVIITFSLIRDIFGVKKILFAFLSLYFFNVFVLFVTHFSGFNAVSLIEKSLPALKNIQFIIYFCFFFAVAKKNNSLKDIKIFLLSIYICFIPNLFYGFSQLATFSFDGYYGMAIINEYSPTLTGAVFYFSAIFSILVNQILTKQDTTIKYLCVCVSFVYLLFVVFSGSRGALMGILSFFLVISVSMFINQLKVGKLKKNDIIIYMVPIIIVVLILTVIILTPSLSSETGTILDKLPNRISALNIEYVSKDGRVDNWSTMISEYFEIINQFPVIALFGLGSGGTYEIFGVLLNASDSQFVYIIVSGGLIGSLLYFNCLVQLYMFGKKQTSKSVIPLKFIFIGLIFSFIIFSISQEVFTLSKTGGLFWIMCGLILGTACSNYNSNQIKNKLVI